MSRDRLRHDAQQHYDTAGSARYEMYRDTVLCVMMGGLRHGRPRRCHTASKHAHALSDRARHDHDTAGHMRDTTGEGATTRPRALHDTKLCARPGRSARAVCSQAG